MPITITSRAQWGAKPWNGTPDRVELAERTEFFVHWHGGQPPFSEGVRVPREIEKIHRGQGWAGVGYNFVVDQAGTIYEGRGWFGQGAHCPDHNRSGIGVQISIGVGQKASAKALSAVRALYDEACRKTGRTLAPKGHKDGLNTACPGPELYAWVHGGMKTGTRPAAGTVPYQPFPGDAFFKGRPKSPVITAMGRRLIAEGCSAYTSGPGEQWTEADRQAYEKWQRKLGHTGSAADGWPGKASWDKLHVPKA
ncbi:peptidoglycan-binding protein [Streptomyces sp. NPDC047097]|uniref:peptidoglycan-binding protein n=1 Tax=Streptomyces sp. NPDC047097 TaxID=3155260 RepID=UPI0033F3AC59